MRNPIQKTADSTVLLDNLSAAIVTTDALLNIRTMNPAAEALFETGRHRIIGRPLVSLYLENGESPAPVLERALLTGHPFTRRQAQLSLLAMPKKVAVDYTVTVVRQPDEEPWLLLEFQSIDRLLRISREEALVAAQQTSRTLMRGLAHEIKNPLGGIRGAAQLLARELEQRGHSGYGDYTHIIIEEADRLRNLVDRMLGANRPLRKEHINIHEVLERVAALIIAESEGRIAFVRDYDPSLPEILCDREQLIQALLNIVRNAFQALESSATRDPVITFRTRAQRRFNIGHNQHRLALQIDIMDNGPGIPLEIQEDVFYPMVSGRADGTGLGLAISQSIISQHQGLIEFESAPGNTRFAIFLPMTSQDETPATSARQPFHT